MKMTKRAALEEARKSKARNEVKAQDRKEKKTTTRTEVAQ